MVQEMNNNNHEKQQRSTWNEQQNQKTKPGENNDPTNTTNYVPSAAPAAASKPGAVPVSQRVDNTAATTATTITTNTRPWNEREHRKIAIDLLKEHKRHIEKNLPRIVYTTTTTTMVTPSLKSTAVVLEDSMSSKNMSTSTSTITSTRTIRNSGTRNNNSDIEAGHGDRIMLVDDDDDENRNPAIDNDDTKNNEKLGGIIPVIVLDATVTSVVTLTAHVVDEKEEQEMAQKIKQLEEADIVEAIPISSDNTDDITKIPEGSCSKKTKHSATVLTIMVLLILIIVAIVLYFVLGREAETKGEALGEALGRAEGEGEAAVAGVSSLGLAEVEAEGTYMGPHHGRVLHI